MGQPARCAQGRHRCRRRHAPAAVLRPEPGHPARSAGSSRRQRDDDADVGRAEKAVLTFPVPDVPGATATATLVNYLPERVVVKNGNDTTEFIYGKWADWNNPLFKIEALIHQHHRRAEERRGRSQRDVKGYRDRPDLRHRAGSGQRAESWKVRMAVSNLLKASTVVVALALLVAPLGAQGGRQAVAEVELQRWIRTRRRPSCPAGNPT